MNETGGGREFIVAFGEVPASRFVRILGGLALGTLAVVTVWVVPIAKEPVAIIRGFLPASAAIIVVVDFLTAYLLWGQARAGRDPAVAMLALGYGGAGVLIAGSTWLFPAAFLVSSARPGNSSVWLWLFSHLFFAGGVLLYALHPRAVALNDDRFFRYRRRALAVALFLLAGLYLLATGQFLSPMAGHGPHVHASVWLTVGDLGFMVVVAACLAWYRRVNTVLDVWLLVAACAAALDLGLVRLGHSRFCVAWYLAHLVSLAGAVSVLAACLFEINRLYSGLVLNREQMSGVNAGLRATNSELAVIAERDELTGLLNRRAIIGRLARAFEDHRNNGYSFTVLMVDLDHFKAINDQLGHLGGDQVLAQVAVRLRNGVRTSDAVGRYGGEEFAILLRDTTEIQARIVAAKLLQAMRCEPFFFEGRAVPVTVSIGVAMVQTMDRTLEELIGRADKALYTAKRQGRDCQVAAERPTGRD